MNSEMIQIIRRSDEAAVEARSLSNLNLTDLLLIERQWESPRQMIHQRLLAAGVDRRRWPESLHWNWKNKFRKGVVIWLVAGGEERINDNEWKGQQSQ